MKSTKQCNVVRMGKPSHLTALKILANILKSKKEDDDPKTDENNTPAPT